MGVHFLTEIDPRARVKSSIDALGFMPVWAHFGRKVVGNLTTVTTSPRSFTTLMLGLYFVDRLVEGGKVREDGVVGAFLKMEQLAAYSRYAVLREGDELDERIFGYRRVRRRIEEHGRPVISAKQDHQILSNQKLYGIWGLYSIAAIASGLRERERARLTAEATDFVERFYLPALRREHATAEQEIKRFLVRDQELQPRKAHRKLAAALAAVHGRTLDPPERDFYGKRLVHPEGAHDGTEGCQGALWQHMSAVNDEGTLAWGQPFGMVEARELVKRARQAGNAQLADRLDRIATLESLLAVAARLFSFLGNRETETPAEVAAELRNQWGDGLTHLEVARLRDLQGLLTEPMGAEGAQRLLDVAERLHDGHYREAIELVLQQNAAVMKGRGNAPWMELDHRGRIAIKLHVGWGDLPEAEHVPHLWEHAYFLDALKTMGARVEGKAAA